MFGNRNVIRYPLVFLHDPSVRKTNTFGWSDNVVVKNHVPIARGKLTTFSYINYIPRGKTSSISCWER